MCRPPKVGHTKNRVESYKFTVFPKVTIRKRSKKLTKCLDFRHPKNSFSFLDQANWRMQKSIKIKNHHLISRFQTPQNSFLFLDQAYWRMEKSMKINLKRLKNQGKILQI
jgi:hypothetical protein